MSSTKTDAEQTVDDRLDEASAIEGELRLYRAIKGRREVLRNALLLSELDLASELRQCLSPAARVAWDADRVDWK